MIVKLAVILFLQLFYMNAFRFTNVPVEYAGQFLIAGFRSGFFATYIAVAAVGFFFSKVGEQHLFTALSFVLEIGDHGLRAGDVLSL